MVATLRHRGPDDRGLFTDGPAALGAARLSIIDVAGGHQPISIDGGAITVVQNGEIYNYVELRAELERARPPLRDGVRHGSDRASVRDRGRRRLSRRCAACSPSRSGTRSRGQLVLARDRVGKKPLYYLQKNGELLFGSETKAILAALPDVPGVNAEALLDFFTFGYVAGEQAAFDGMQRLEPGTALIVDVAHRRRRAPSRFWRWPERAGSRRDAARRRRSSGSAPS